MAKHRVYFYPKGTWKKVSEVTDYIKDMGEYTKRLRPGFTSLFDATHFAAPTQEITNLILEGTALIRGKAQEISAIIVSSSIIKMYLDKYKDEMDTDKMTTMYFDDMTETETWLDEM